MRVSLYTGRHFKPAEVERVSEHPRCPRTLETRLLNAGNNFSVVTSSRITNHVHFRAKQFLQHRFESRTSLDNSFCSKPRRIRCETVCAPISNPSLRKVRSASPGRTDLF